jgi:GntR family transcriptional repressor for pyruvate dehydrogenase complex
MNFKPVKNENIYMLVINQVRDLIKNGDILPGDKLPSERKLTELLSVSRATVRQATSALSALGIVEVKQGRGNYIVESIDRDSLLDLFTRIIVGEQISPEEVMETRMMVEGTAALLCATRRSEAFVAEMEVIIAKNRSAARELRIDELPAINREFHLKIAEGTENRGIMRMMQELMFIMKANLWPLIKNITYSNEEKVIDHLSHHERVFLAIKNRDGPLAEKEMRMHLETIEREFEEEGARLNGRSKSSEN